MGINIRGIMIGEGRPKICVPVMGTRKEEVLALAEKLPGTGAELVELRADYLSYIPDAEEFYGFLKELRQMLREQALLFTFRSRTEGGKGQLSVEAYQRLCEAACESGQIDLLDVEAYLKEGLMEELSGYAHDHGVKVVGSSHEFQSTPPEAELVKRLWYMDRAGVDIPKVAVMPREKKDVLALMSAVLSYREQGGSKPVIAMSMGEMGLISRLAGEWYGSAVTFAAEGHASAPGQIPYEEVKQILEILHLHAGKEIENGGQGDMACQG